jgi:hypothetical protein
MDGQIAIEFAFDTNTHISFGKQIRQSQRLEQ